MEIKILDMIQNLHTTVGDHFFIGITKLGDAGIIWIFLTILLLILNYSRLCRESGCKPHSYCI